MRALSAELGQVRPGQGQSVTPICFRGTRQVSIRPFSRLCAEGPLQVLCCTGLLAWRRFVQGCKCLVWVCVVHYCACACSVQGCTALHRNPRGLQAAECCVHCQQRVEDRAVATAQHSKKPSTAQAPPWQRHRQQGHTRTDIAHFKFQGSGSVLKGFFWCTTGNQLSPTWSQAQVGSAFVVGACTALHGCC